MGIRNVKIKSLRKVPPFRRAAVGTWGHPTDPQIYGTLEVDLTKAYAWRDSLPDSGPRLTVTHMVARAIALAMAEYPDLNGLIRFRKIYLRQTVDIFFQVTVEHESGREDLAGIRIAEVDKKGVVQIAEEMARKVERVREKRNTPVQKTSRMLSLLPGFMMRFVLNLTAFISYTLNIRFPGIPKDLFGGCMISNVGALGLDLAFAPLVPYSRTPLVLLVGQAKKRPVVVGDTIEAREIVTLNATIDHRFCDGALLAKMVRVIQKAFAAPEEYFVGPAA